MKKLFALLFVFSICFSFASCSSKDEGETTKEYRPDIPIVKIRINVDDNAEYRALTRDGTYIWTEVDDNGEEKIFEYNGDFCLDDKNLCTFTREQTEGKITLNFAGSVISHKVYCAPKDEIESSKIKIYDEKYLVTTTSKTITFHESGEYYYVIKVNYTQGEVAYGFLLTE